EDDPELAASDLKDIHVSEKDTVIGLAASGRTPYVIGGLQYSKQCGAHTVAISCNKHAQVSQYADIPIEVEVGPEILTGSSRSEDDPDLAASDLKDIHVSEKDTVIGLAASVRTPYVIGGLQYSKQCGAHTVAISCNKHAQVSQYADIPIEVEVGPEILTGST